jgi:hypothetical protein
LIPFDHEAERKRIAEGMAVRLRVLRLSYGYESMAAFARFLDLPASTVRRCEAGRLVGTRRVLALSFA